MRAARPKMPEKSTANASFVGNRTDTLCVAKNWGVGNAEQRLFPSTSRHLPAAFIDRVRRGSLEPADHHVPGVPGQERRTGRGGRHPAGRLRTMGRDRRQAISTRAKPAWVCRRRCKPRASIPRTNRIPRTHGRKPAAFPRRARADRCRCVGGSCDDRPAGWISSAAARCRSRG